MNLNEKVTLLFLFVCIPLRILEVVLIALYAETLRIPIIIILSLQSLGFGISSAVRGKYGSLGQTRWWSSLFHCIMFGATCLSFILKVKGSWIILAIDVSCGFFGFIIYHFQTNTFVT